MVVIGQAGWMDGINISAGDILFTLSMAWAVNTKIGTKIGNFDFIFAKLELCKIFSQDWI